MHAENHLYHLANNGTELENIVLKLRDALGELRRSAERQQRRLALAVVAVLCGVIVLAGGGWWAYQQIDTGMQQIAVVNTEKIRAHLRETVEETHRRELADAQKATDCSSASACVTPSGRRMPCDLRRSMNLPPRSPK